MRTHTKRHRHSLPGVQHLWGFDNGHLASVVPDRGDTTRWQLAVLDGSGAPKLSTPIWPEAIGSLTPIEVRRILRRIEALP